MKKICAIAVFGLGIITAAVSPAQATTPVATYEYSMDGGMFSDSVGSSTLTPAATCSSPAATDLCNIAAHFGSDPNGDFWHWRTTQGFGGGAVLDTPSDLGSTYSIYIKFAIDEHAHDIAGSNCRHEESNYSSIINLNDLTSDYGLYTAGCDPLYLSTGYDTAEASINLGDVAEVVFTRNSITDELKAFVNYANGFEESWVYDDSAQDFLIAGHLSGSRVRLFQDDGIDVSNEGLQEGRFYGIKLWADTALTLEQIESLATVTPGSNGGGGNAGGGALAPTGGNSAVVGWVLGLALVAGAGAFALRRRNV